MRLERLADAQAVALRAADLVAETLATNPDAVLLAPAGRTPVPFYAELVRRVRAGSLDLSRAHFFQLDELLGVPPDDPRSFHAFLREHLAGPLGLTETFHGLDGSAPDPAAEIERHRTRLEERGPADLVLLGLGRNGHVAFNEPGVAPGDRARVVALAASTLNGLANSFPNGVPRKGLTLGMAEIAAGRDIALLVTGPSKREVLARVLRGPAVTECPASLLGGHDALVVLADAAAADGA